MVSIPTGAPLDRATTPLTSYMTAPSASLGRPTADTPAHHVTPSMATVEVRVEVAEWSGGSRAAPEAALAATPTGRRSDRRARPARPGCRSPGPLSPAVPPALPAGRCGPWR